MATSFQIIFKRFLNKITDTDFVALPTENIDSILTEFLESSIARFQKCKKDINNFDSISQTFTDDLSSVEIEILADWMKYQWIEQQINREELLKQSLSSKDYSMYSQANHLDKMIVLKQNLYNEINQMITDYTYDFGSIKDLG